MSTAGMGLTKPDAGVIATSPATAPETARFARHNPFRAHPCQNGGGGREVGGDKGAGCQCPCADRAACVESEPADPQQTRSNYGEHDTMRPHRFTRVAFALAEIYRT